MASVVPMNILQTIQLVMMQMHVLSMTSASLANAAVKCAFVMMKSNAPWILAIRTLDAPMSQPTTGATMIMNARMMCAYQEQGAKMKTLTLEPSAS